MASSEKDAESFENTLLKTTPKLLHYFKAEQIHKNSIQLDW